MILAGWYNAYCAEAKVYHSHNYTILQEVRRYFDTGAFHDMEPWIHGSFGQAEGEGVRFVLAELVYLMKHKPLLVPSTFLRDGCKFLGYKLGMNYRRLPVTVRRKCSRTKRYWK